MTTSFERNATVAWDGRVKDGDGLISTDSGALRDARYSFATRFENHPGTNPEELLAASLAACFAMSLSYELQTAKLNETHIETTASVKIELVDGTWTIQGVRLFLKARLHGSPSLPFLLAASRAKAVCPIARVLSTRLTLHTELADQHPGSEVEAEVVVYTSSYCQVCGQTKELLESSGIRYREVDLDKEPAEMANALKQKTGRMSVPQIFVGEHYVGTYDDLIQLAADHGLKPLLQPERETKTVATEPRRKAS